MKTIGLLVAVEMGSVLKSGFTCVAKEQVGRFPVHVYALKENRVIAIQSGAGQVMAAAATEILISVYHVDLIVNFGLAGALTETIGLEQVCVVERVVDYAFDTSEADGCEVGRHLGYPSVYLKTDEALLQRALMRVPALKRVSCASGMKFVGTREERAQINRRFHCDIVEMEAAGIVLTADMHNVGVLLIKGVSDTVHGGREEFMAMFERTSDTCFQVIVSLMDSL